MNPIFENKSEITLEKYIYQCNNPVGRKAKRSLKRWKTTQISGMVVMFIITAMAVSYKAYPIALVAGLFVEPGLWNKLFHKSLFNGLLNDNFLDLSIKNVSSKSTKYSCILLFFMLAYWFSILMFDKLSSVLAASSIVDTIASFQDWFE